MEPRICFTHSIRGDITVPGDKSISHRGIMFGAIADGTTRLFGFLDGADCRSTIACFRSLGIEIRQKGAEVCIEGKGLYGLSEPRNVLDVGNSGTTLRLIAGILAAQPFQTTLTGDASIRKRPMKRIIDPLTQMGGQISSTQQYTAPLVISGRTLSGITYHTPVASAQVKSCILLAGLYADGPTTVIEPSLSRDHTERMLAAFGASLHREGTVSVIEPGSPLHAQDIQIPGDISSAAPFIAAALLAEEGELLIRNVNINPTRAGLLSVISDMGGHISLLNSRIASGEEVADLLIQPSALTGTVVAGDMIPTLIDELPVVAILAAFARGQTIVKDAGELRVKESDRIALICDNLGRMGCDITPTEDGFLIEGGRPLSGIHVHTAHDHRMAMACAIAGSFARGETTFDDARCVAVSYPGFFDTLRSISSLSG